MQKAESKQGERLQLVVVADGNIEALFSPGIIPGTCRTLNGEIGLGNRAKNVCPLSNYSERKDGV